MKVIDNKNDKYYLWMKSSFTFDIYIRLTIYSDFVSVK